MAASDDLKQIRAAVRRGSKVKYGSRTYTLTEARDELIPMLEKQVEREAAASRAAEERPGLQAEASKLDERRTELAINKAEKILAEANKIVENMLNKFNKGEVTEEDYKASTNLVAVIENDIADMRGGRTYGRATEDGGYVLVPFSESERAGVTTGNVGGGPDVIAGRGTAARTRVPSSNVDAELRRLLNLSGGRSEDGTPPPPPTGGTGGGTGGGVGGTGGGVGGAGGGKGKGQKSSTSPAFPDNWEDLVRRDYAKYAWMLTDLDRTKYADVFKLLAEAVDPETGITDQDVFDARFMGTSWYRELETAQTARRVRDAVGALSFDSGNYAKFLNKALNMGWEGENLKAEAYKEVFRKNDDGTYANKMAADEARKSNAYLSIKKIGTQFMLPLSDERTEQVLTGGSTVSDLQRIAREQAKINYPHLAAAIDAGVTLEDLALDYRQTAATTLGVPLDSVPMSRDYLDMALNGGDATKPRMMTTSEWKYKLKSDPTYGYQYTAKAEEEVNKVMLGLEKALGFRK